MRQWDADGAFGLAGGCAAMVAAAFVTAAAFPPDEVAARLVVFSLATAVTARVIKDGRAAAGVVAVAAPVFIGFLAGHAGDLTGDRTPWPHAATIVLAFLVGRGWRSAAGYLEVRARRTPAHRPSDPVTSGRSAWAAAAPRGRVHAPAHVGPRR